MCDEGSGSIYEERSSIIVDIQKPLAHKVPQNVTPNKDGSMPRSPPLTDSSPSPHKNQVEVIEAGCQTEDLAKKEEESQTTRLT